MMRFISILHFFLSNIYRIHLSPYFIYFLLAFLNDSGSTGIPHKRKIKILRIFSCQYRSYSLNDQTQIIGILKCRNAMSSSLNW